MNKYCVYKHICPDNQIYIGITRQTPEMRWRNGEGYINQWFYQAIERWGWNNISHEIMFNGLSKQIAEEIEQKLIDEYHSWCPGKGYNDTLGGKRRDKSFPVRDTETNKVYANAKMCSQDSGVSLYTVYHGMRNMLRNKPYYNSRFEMCCEENLKDVTFICQ